jgi:hypothetical protein
MHHPMCVLIRSVNNVVEDTYRRLCTDLFGHFYISFLWGHALLLANKPYASGILMYIILVTSTPIAHIRRLTDSYQF